MLINFYPFYVYPSDVAKEKVLLYTASIIVINRWKNSLD